MKIAVIGGGAVGLFSAWRLAQTGARVTLIEAAPAHSPDPHAASWAAAGMLGAVSEFISPHSGPIEARFEALCGEALAAWDDAAQALGGDLVAPCGTLVLGDTPERAARLPALLDKARALGREAQLFDDSSAQFGFAAAAPGAWLPFEGVAYIPDVFAQLRLAFAEAGGQSVFGNPAVEAARGGVRLRDGAHIEADQIVIAPGWGGVKDLARFVPELALLAPAKGQMLMVEEETSCVVRASGAYAAPRGAGCVIGSTMEHGRDDCDTDPETLNRLQAAAGKAAPLLRDAARVRAWAGVRPMSPDGAPILGASRLEGCVVAAGHSRNGWLLAPVSAEMVVDIVLARAGAARAAAFSAARFG